MSNIYLDPYVYQRAATGHDTTTLVANLCRIASPGTTQGATSIPLTAPTTTLLNIFDQVYVFDGASSEIAIVTATTTQGATSIPVQALQYAHSAGVPLCSDGSTGSLAQAITDASTDLEDYCRQSLFQATYSNETLPLRSMRAAITRNGQLVVHPKHTPVTAISSISLLIQGLTTVTLSTNYAQLDADGLVLTMTQLSSSSGSSTFWGAFSPPAQPTTPGFVQLSYTAGFLYSAMPADVRQAAIWLTSDLLSDRRNPTGAAEVQQGKTHLVTKLRGDLTGESTLVTRAHARLNRYRQRAM